MFRLHSDVLHRNSTQQTNTQFHIGEYSVNADSSYVQIAGIAFTSTLFFVNATFNLVNLGILVPILLTAVSCRVSGKKTS